MKMYPIHPISITATNDDLKISITHGSTKVEIPKDVNQKFNSRNWFFASQTPKRANFKSYQRVNKKAQDLLKFTEDATLSTVERNYEREKKQLDINEGQRLNLATVYPNPLKNDFACDKLVMQERRAMYDYYFNNPIPIDYHRRSIEHSNYNGSKGRPASEWDTVNEDELMIRGEKFY